MSKESSDSEPFGAQIDAPAPKRKRTRKKAPARAKEPAAEVADSKEASPAAEDAPKPKRRRRASKADEAPAKDEATTDSPAEPTGQEGEDPPRRRRRRRKDAGEGESAMSDAAETGEPESASAAEGQAPDGDRPEGDEERPGRRRRRRRRRRKSADAAEGEGSDADPSRPTEDATGEGATGDGERPRRERVEPTVGEGMLFLDRGGIASLRPVDDFGHASKKDVFVPKNLVAREKLREGMVVKGRFTKGQKHKYQLADVQEIDGLAPKAWRNSTAFRNLTSIDPDFHYATGDALKDTSMRIVDLISPIGRGQRGLLVAPPRSGKTTLLRTFARGIESTYPDVHLFVLLIDERPEEATEWSRSLERGKVFASTADETPKHHIQLAEAVWKRCCRLVEMGEEVVLLIDSLTRLARAYNNQLGSGKTMSGGLDSRAMEHPRKLFGSARNTEKAGSLTILGTILVDTGSRMDQLVFEEFKGTGNMELVLNRRLADRRIFPAIDVEKSGTRKEEKLVGLKRLQQIHTLRRVMARLHFAEAMEMLITRLDEIDKTDDFLQRFTVDPEA